MTAGPSVPASRQCSAKLAEKTKRLNAKSIKSSSINAVAIQGQTYYETQELRQSELNFKSQLLLQLAA